MMRRLPYLAMLVAGCGIDSPSGQPTWAADVKPILEANCVRCHGVPAIGGAPDGFRLDRYENTVDDDGRVIVGARIMAPFIAERVDPAVTKAAGIDPMPPRFGLSDRQMDILLRWYGAAAAEQAPRGSAPGNRAPTMEIVWPLQDSLVDGKLAIQYELRDPDFETVAGELYFDSVIEDNRIGSVQTGRGTVLWDVGAMPEGTYQLIAQLDDGEVHDVAVASYEVVHNDNNLAPTIRILRPVPFDLLHDNDALTVDLEIGDGDDDPLAITVSAVRGDERVIVDTLAAATAGTFNLPWDVAGLTEGGGWHIEVTVDDGTTSRTVTSRPFRISHQTTSLTFADISDVNLQCLNCHGQGGLAQDVSADFDLAAPEWRGRIYRRVVEQRTMPPAAAAVFDTTITEAQRAALAEWLLGGAP